MHVLSAASIRANDQALRRSSGGARRGRTLRAPRAQHRPSSAASECEPLDDHSSAESQQRGCGGARAPSDTVSAFAPSCFRRCARMRSISSGSSTLAVTASRPPQRAHRSISMPNTRFSRRAQLSATCFGLTRSGARLRAFDPRPASVIAERSATFAAKTKRSASRGDERSVHENQLALAQ